MVQFRSCSDHLFKTCLALCWMFLLGLNVNAQNKRISDSLIIIYETENYEPEDLIGLLEEIAAKNPDPDETLMYSDLLLQKAFEYDSIRGIYKAYLQKGNAYEAKGDLSKSLDYYFKAVDKIDELGDRKEMAKMYIAIAGVYDGLGSRKNSIEYYFNAIETLKDVDREAYAVSIENLGDMYLGWQKPDSALVLFEQSGKIFNELGNTEYIAYNKGNTGLAYAQKGLHDAAEANISEAVVILEEIGNYRPITTYLTFMSDIYAERNDWDSAFDYSLRALRLAEKLGIKAEISEAYLKLSELYEKTGYPAAALKYYRNHISFRDSVQNVAAVQEVMNNELDRSKMQIELLDQRRKTQKILVIATAIALFLIILFAISLIRRNRFIRRTNAIIELERDRSDKLLLNILPEKTADELKKFGAVKADKLESVTVLFTDFLSFTKHSERTDPELLVNTIGTYFTAFDDIVERYGLEKIKTIGDSYMCAGGLPEPLGDHALKMVQAAFDIMHFVEERRANRDEGEPEFDMRVGINTGPVVAGVVGHNKFSYDIWGDTVNVAARMERLSEAGKINISQSTYELVKDHFECEYRGEFEVKNKGMMKMYFVTGKYKEKKLNIHSRTMGQNVKI